MKNIYTTAIHVKRLREMLYLTKGRFLNYYCPAASLNAKYSPFESWNDKTCPCDVCRSFVNSRGDYCPCTYFGPDKARTISEEAIKKYDQEQK